MAVAGHAEWGFVPQEWFIAVPSTWALVDTTALGASFFADDAGRRTFLKANFHHIRVACGSDELALFVAMYRLHLANQGVLKASLAARSVIEDEYVKVAAKGVNWDDPLNDIPAIPVSSSIAKFIKHHGNTLLHQLVYVFSARGHHWDNAFNDLYDRLKKACFISGNQGFNMPTNEVLYRLSIHGFGIKPLVDLTLHHHGRNEMAAAMFLRFTPTTPIAGVAHITTLRATLITMAQESWWTVFEAKFHDAIAAINNEVARIIARPYEYHVASKVFGHNVRLVASADAMNAFARLCQFALGYIDHLGRRHSLSGQQAITSKSGGPRGVAEAFSRACDHLGKPDANVDSMEIFLASV
jgi:hypothetical protein